MAKYNFVFPDSTTALPELLQHLSSQGSEVGSRAGRVLELDHVGITLTEPWKRELLVPGRKPSIAAQIAETAWVLAGRNDIGWLSHYLPRARDFSDDGGLTWRASYGRRIRRWPRRDGTGDVVDQLRYVVDTLQKQSGSRRAVIGIWDPAVDTAEGFTDIPCNDVITFSVRNGLVDMHVFVRSNDIIWGWSGINVFEWSTLQEIVARLLEYGVGSLHFSTTSLHIYQKHWARSLRIRQLVAGGLDDYGDSPRFDPSGVLSSTNDPVGGLDDVLDEWFRIEEKIRTGAPVGFDVEKFPEPMLQSWLRVLQWWWNDDDRRFIRRLAGTRLHAAATLFSIEPPSRTKPEVDVNLGPTPQTTLQRKLDVAKSIPSEFAKMVFELHAEKSRAYGDSWKRRGEMLGILANVARKIDRLGGYDTSDETSTDTAVDLMIYLAKYLTWTKDQEVAACDLTPLKLSDYPANADALIIEVESNYNPIDPFYREPCEQWLKDRFEDLIKAADKGNTVDRDLHIREMLRRSYELARHLWEEENGDDYRGADHD